MDSFPIRALKARPIDMIPFWLGRAAARLDSSLPLPISSAFRFSSLVPIITDKNVAYSKILAGLESGRSHWLSGYWQSPEYFDEYRSHIFQELSPPEPKHQLYVDVGRAMAVENSVAIGIRLYEEALDPSQHSSDGKSKDASEISAAIAEIENSVADPVYYVFCSHNSPLIAEVMAGRPHFVLTPEFGYSDSTSTLWLLAQCHHHVFTNSTFYWWGAWLSKTNWNSDSQMIYAANNFVNRDCLPVDWATF